MENPLTLIWLSIIGFFLLYYVINDGSGLGVGILCLFSGRYEDQRAMMESVGYVWHTNQTWLVIVGGLLFGAFPLCYSILFSALYIPAMFMLVGLILRGVAVDFHEHSRSGRFWAKLFGLGSLWTAVTQGLLAGGLLSGIAVKDGQFAGGMWDWFNPLSIFIAVGVVPAYLMLGSNYLIKKTEGDLQQRVFRWSRISSATTLLISLVAFLWINAKYPYASAKWSTPRESSYVVYGAVATALGFAMLFRSLWKKRERGPLFWNAVVATFGFVTLGMNLYPNMIPHVVSPVTAAEASASPRTLIFMLVVTGILIPVLVFYTSYTHRVFRGKVKAEE